MSTGGWMVLAIIVVIAIWAIMIYNGLVALRNRFKNAFAQIDVQLKRRYDLIPNLVETAKGYLKHERETLEAVIKARNQAVAAAQGAAANPGNPAAMQSLGQAEGALTGALGRLFALAEAYPDLKANQNMLALQEELTSTENKVAFARQAFNDSVMEYNTKRESFPDNIFAGMFGFDAAELLERDRIGRGAQGAEGLVHVAWISSSSRSARAAVRAGWCSGTRWRCSPSSPATAWSPGRSTPSSRSYRCHAGARPAAVVLRGGRHRCRLHPGGFGLIACGS